MKNYANIFWGWQNFDNVSHFYIMKIVDIWEMKCHCTWLMRPQKFYFNFISIGSDYLANIKTCFLFRHQGEHILYNNRWVLNLKHIIIWYFNPGLWKHFHIKSNEFTWLILITWGGGCNDPILEEPSPLFSCISSHSFLFSRSCTGTSIGSSSPSKAFSNSSRITSQSAG